MKKRLVATVILFTLVGCAQQDGWKPAPVQTIVLNKAYSKHNYGTINSAYYVIRPGDTLYSIAWQSGLEVNHLAKINGISAPYLLSIGQKLLINPASKQTSTRSDSVKKRTSGKYKAATASTTAKTTKTSPHKSVSTNKSTIKSENQPSKAPVRLTSASKERKISSGKWQWPVDGTLLQGYTDTEGLKGIRLAGKRGEPIYASASGKVVYAGNALRGYGNLIIIAHSDDTLSAYAHSDRILVREKQQIEIGEKIAELGSTGLIGAEPHLYFEIRKFGKQVNPLSLLPKK